MMCSARSRGGDFAGLRVILHAFDTVYMYSIATISEMWLRILDVCDDGRQSFDDSKIRRLIRLRQ